MNNEPFYRKLGAVIGRVGGALAAIALICMIAPSLRETANVYFIIGVGLLTLSGVIMSAPVIMRGVADLMKVSRH